MIKDSEGRNVSLQERYGNLQMRRVEIKEKTASEKESIKSQKSVIEQKRQDLLMCQQTSLTLGIQCNSSNLTPRGEAKFLGEQLGHLDVLKSTTEKVDDLEDQIVVTEREIERLKSENEIAATELQVAYHEVRRISKGYEGLAMAEVKDKSSTNVMAENVATFADAFEVAHQNKEDLGGPKF
jgi:predicted  nucleic acid-binding Zn-ribbon protein